MKATVASLLLSVNSWHSNLSDSVLLNHVTSHSVDPMLKLPGCGGLDSEPQITVITNLVLCVLPLTR
jgi:hypothetical protein